MNIIHRSKTYIYEIIQSLIISLFIPLTFLTYNGVDVGISLGQDIIRIFSANIPITILIFILTFALFRYMALKDITPNKQDTLLAILFSVFIVIGCLYSSSQPWIKDTRNILRILLKASALILLFRKLIAFLNFGVLKLSQKDATLNKEDRLLGKHAFRNTTISLLVLWLPIMILSYPGNLSGDTLMQIWEALGIKEYWAHNPLFHTLILKFFLSLGDWLFGSISVGFFLCSIAQCIAMAMVLGYSMQRLYERGVGKIARYIIFAVYMLTPTYSNMATTPGKDMAYMTLFLLYILFMEKIIFCFDHKDNIQNKAKSLTPAFFIGFILVSILLCLVRKNGIYIIVPTGIILVLLFIKKLNFKSTLFILLMCCVIPFTGFKVTQGFLETVTDAEKGSIREMLSIPFQQTARYLNIYGNEISDFEREAIDTVLLDADLVGRIYTPDISDPVKALYNNNATTQDLINYFKAWFIGLTKHPIVYFDAFFQHIYGWFYPGVVNVIRYHATDDLIIAPNFFVKARESIKIFYETLGHIPPFSLLENIGAYTFTIFWLLFRKGKKLKEKWLLFPLFFSLLICMASPVFYDNPRYAYPILISVPFVSAILLSRQYSIEQI